MQSHWDDIQIKVAGTGIVRASADVGGSAGIIRPVRPLRSPVDLSFISCARLGDDWTAGSYHRRDWTGGKHPTDQKLHLQLFVYRPIAAALRKSPKKLFASFIVLFTQVLAQLPAYYAIHYNLLPSNPVLQEAYGRGWSRDDLFHQSQLLEYLDGSSAHFDLRISFNFNEPLKENRIDSTWPFQRDSLFKSFGPCALLFQGERQNLSFAFIFHLAALIPN